MKTQKNRLILLKNRGFSPKYILDIGAHQGEWAQMARETFPGSEIHLFEANKEHEQTLAGLGFASTSICLLGDSDDKTAEFYSIKNGPYSTGDSMYRENTKHYRDENCVVESKPVVTLDTLLKGFEARIKPDFIKLDVQGAELDILRGAKEALTTTQAVLLEAQVVEYNKGAPKLFEVMSFMDSEGFEMYDILGLHYLPSGILNQTDILFLKKGSFLIPSGELV